MNMPEAGGVWGAHTYNNAGGRGRMGSVPAKPEQ